MFHDPFAGDPWLKDEIARELFEEADHAEDGTDHDGNRPGEAGGDAAAGRDTREPPSFLTGSAGTDVDILTGEARED